MYTKTSMAPPECFYNIIIRLDEHTIETVPYTYLMTCLVGTHTPHLGLARRSNVVVGQNRSHALGQKKKKVVSIIIIIYQIQTHTCVTKRYVAAQLVVSHMSNSLLYHLLDDVIVIYFSLTHT